MKHSIIKFFFTAFYSFYSKKLYIYVYEKWTGFAFKYLMSIALLLSLPGLALFPVMYDIYNIANSNDPTISNSFTDGGRIFEEILDQLPEITITKERASIEEEEPFVIYDRPYNMPIAIIDTKSDKSNIEGQILSVNKHSIYINTKGKVAEYDLKDIAAPTDEAGAFSINAQTIRDTIVHNKVSLLYVMPIMATIFGFLAILVSISIKAALFASISFLIINKPEKRVEFTPFFRLATVALTPSVIAELIFILLPNLFSLKFIGSVLFGLSIVYFIYALNVVRKEK